MSTTGSSGITNGFILSSLSSSAAAAGFMSFCSAGAIFTGVYSGSLRFFYGENYFMFITGEVFVCTATTSFWFGICLISAKSIFTHEQSNFSVVSAGESASASEGANSRIIGLQLNFFGSANSGRPSI